MLLCWILGYELRVRTDFLQTVLARFPTSCLKLESWLTGPAVGSVEPQGQHLGGRSLYLCEDLPSATIPWGQIVF